MQQNTRQPAVAGMFYPDDPVELHEMITEFLRDARRHEDVIPKALIVPHAGYIYSGPVAASAYANLEKVAERITRVILLGPSHRVGFSGLAASGAARFSTPLGDIPVDQASVDSILALPQVRVFDQAHALEHSLEVHLPFLQEVLGDFSIVPLVVG
ncbi:MAG: AmmeMemoRadiSam system protein B, partial [Halobacteria archaeon]|nr:AmmeMemoRadiSam system protein B [Halobacteria archaeon]